MLGFLSKAVALLFGGGAAAPVAQTAAQTVVQTVAKTADNVIYTAQERADSDAADLANARSFAAPGNYPGLINQLVDAFNRAIRPGVLVWLIGGFSGFWKLPNANEMGEFWQNVLMLVLTFWFGGRAILKDLPSAVRAIRGR